MVLQENPGLSNDKFHFVIAAIALVGLFALLHCLKSHLPARCDFTSWYN